MSVLHLYLHGKKIWDSPSWNAHNLNLIKDTLSGSIFGHLIVDKVLKRWAPYNSSKEAVALLIAQKVSPNLGQVSSDLSQKILEHALDKPHIAKISVLLKNKAYNTTRGQYLSIASSGYSVFKRASYDYLFGPKKTEELPAGNGTGTVGLIRYLYGNFSYKKTAELLRLIAKGEFAEVSQRVLIPSLQPACEKAVQSSISSLIRGSVSSGIDFTAKTAISTLFYTAMIYTLFQISNAGFQQQQLDASLARVGLYATAIQTAFIASTAIKNYLTEPPIDGKAELHKLVLRYSKEPIEKKLRAAPLFKYLEVDQETIDSFIDKVTASAIEVYWEPLKEKKVFRLPLVQ